MRPGPTRTGLIVGGIMLASVGVAMLWLVAWVVAMVAYL